MSWASIILSTSALTCVIRFGPKINTHNGQDTEIIYLIAFNSDFLWIDMQAGIVT